LMKDIYICIVSLYTIIIIIVIITYTIMTNVRIKNVFFILRTNCNK